MSRRRDGTRSLFSPAAAERRRAGVAAARRRTLTRDPLGSPEDHSCLRNAASLECRVVFVVSVRICSRPHASVTPKGAAVVPLNTNEVVDVCTCGGHAGPATRCLLKPDLQSLKMHGSLIDVLTYSCFDGEKYVFVIKNQFLNECKNRITLMDTHTSDSMIDPAERLGCIPKR